MALSKFHVHRSIFGISGPQNALNWEILKLCRPAGATQLLDSCQIYKVYAGLSFVCFKFEAFLNVNRGFIGKQTQWGIFSVNFWSPLAPKLLVGSEKVCGCKNGTDILLSACTVWWRSGFFCHTSSELKTCARFKGYIVAVYQYWSILMQFSAFQRMNGLFQ